MIKLIDLMYYSETALTEPGQLFAKQKESLGYLQFVRDPLQVEVIRHLNHEGSAECNGIGFRFFQNRNSFWSTPFKTHFYIRNARPDMVLAQGFGFPLQVLFLRLILHSNCKILVQHHGENPSTGIKFIFQKLAGWFTDGVVFTTSGNARAWHNKKVIPANVPVFELLEASTNFTRTGKQDARTKLGLEAGQIFLWVGRLNANKDPLTVLRAFAGFCREAEGAKLFMIFHEKDMLQEVQNFISETDIKKHVELIGRVPHQEMNTWFNAADFYLSASHHEGSGFALLEAMSCGCIPIVTNIPSFREITGEGKFGFLYQAGKADELLEILRGLKQRNLIEWPDAIQTYFMKELSFEAIARNLSRICQELLAK